MIKTEYVSTLDLRDEPDIKVVSMGNRSRSVPGLDVQVVMLLCLIIISLNVWNQICPISLIFPYLSIETSTNYVFVMLFFRILNTAA